MLMKLLQKNRASKMTILWISFFFDNNPALHNILNQLSEMGHSPILISPQAKSSSQAKNVKARIISIPVKRIPLLSPVIFAIVLIFYLPISIVSSGADVVILEPYPQILSTFSSFFVTRIRKVKLILDIRTTPVEAKGFRDFLTRFWFSLSVLVAKKFFDGTTIITHLMKKEICERFVLNPEKVGTWTSGVSDGLFNPKRNLSEGLRIKRKYDLFGKFIVFYHGIFTPTRGLAETLAAHKILASKYPDIVMFLLGNGPMAITLQETIKKEGLQRNVIIAEPVEHSEVPKYVSMCDIGIVPLPNNSYWRFQSPLKLLEYLAMEKVIVLTDIEAHRGVVGYAKCGIYLSSIEPEKIAEAIEYAYLNRASLVEWGRIGRKIVKANYTWAKVAVDLQNYLLLVKKRRNWDFGLSYGFMYSSELANQA